MINQACLFSCPGQHNYCQQLKIVWIHKLNKESKSAKWVLNSWLNLWYAADLCHWPLGSSFMSPFMIVFRQASTLQLIVRDFLILIKSCFSKHQLPKLLPSLRPACIFISIEGAQSHRIHKTYDNHSSHPSIPPVRHIALNELDRPKIDLIRSKMT